jgi:hypothetical protein
VDIGHRPNQLDSLSLFLILIYLLDYVFLHVSELCVFTWYQSYRLTPIFDPVPIFFFFVYSSFCILYHNQNQLAHKYPSCTIFFSLCFLILPHFLILCQSYFSSHTQSLESLFVKMTCHIAIVSSTSKYHTPNSLLLKRKEKKKRKKRFHAHSWPNFGHSSHFRPKLLCVLTDSSKALYACVCVRVRIYI